LHIAAPCEKAWDTMGGPRERRFCDACGKHVHDLASLPEGEVERLLALSPRGEVCVRIERDYAARAALTVVDGATLAISVCSSASEPLPASPPDAGPPPVATVEPSPREAPEPRHEAFHDPTAPSPPASPVQPAPASAPAQHHAFMGCVCVPGDPLCTCL
jgi:hypothetical protein